MKILANQSKDISTFLEAFDQVELLVKLYEQIHSIFQFHYQDFQVSIKCDHLETIQEHISKIETLISVRIPFTFFSN